jgi:glycosyltransferase involved in cell wall biosynthesis
MKKLSIALTTYNHEAYIADALNSILEQQLSIPYEIVIGNDCSTDKTQAIINDYSKRHEGLVRSLPIETNLGYIKNFDLTMQSCEGEYIAIFDGDDIMYPGKLSKQVAFLDENPNCVMVGHNARAFVSETNETLRTIKPKYKKSKYTILDLVKYGSFFANSTKMFRKEAYPKDGIDRNIEKIADWYITLELAKKGDIGFIHETLVDYRVHKSSIMQSIPGHVQAKDIRYILDKIAKSMPEIPSRYFNRQYCYAHIADGISYSQEGNKSSAREEFLRAIKKDPFYGLTAYYRLIRSFF